MKMMEMMILSCSLNDPLWVEKRRRRSQRRKGRASGNRIYIGLSCASSVEISFTRVSGYGIGIKHVGDRELQLEIVKEQI